MSKLVHFSKTFRTFVLTSKNSLVSICFEKKCQKVIYFSDKSLKNRYLLYTWVFFLNWNLPSDLALQKAPGNRRQTISKTLLNSNFIFFFTFWVTFPTTFLISKQKRSYPSGSLFSTEVTKRAFLLLLLLCVHYTLKRIWGARKKYPSNGSWACKTPSTKWKVELNLRRSLCWLADT